MGVQGIEGMTVGQLRQEIEEGARFVYYTYCIWIMVMTLQRPS